MDTTWNNHTKHNIDLPSDWAGKSGHRTTPNCCVLDWHWKHRNIWRLTDKNISVFLQGLHNLQTATFVQVEQVEYY